MNNLNAINDDLMNSLVQLHKNGADKQVLDLFGKFVSSFAMLRKLDIDRIEEISDKILEAYNTSWNLVLADRFGIDINQSCRKEVELLNRQLLTLKSYWPKVALNDNLVRLRTACSLRV